HHQMFYFQDGTHIFKAENLLFRVHKSVLCDKSITFKEMFTANEDSEAILHPVDGASDTESIIVPNQVTTAAFKLFLLVCYNKWHPDTSQVSENIICQLLELGQMYQSKVVHDHTISQLNACHWSIDASWLISIALKYHIKDIFHYAFNQMVPRYLNQLGDSDFDHLTEPVWKVLLWVKEQLEFHHHIVACEPPEMVHSPNCKNGQECNNDWQQLWWNGMGRFLLDGHNPLPYSEVVEQFQGLCYGGVHLDCWRAMLSLIKAGKAFCHEHILIDQTSQGLAELLIFKPFLDEDL
ncbi:hypothetical protein V8B97DRAFT_2065509, partial [Scleroderma yunnanense]